MRGKELTGDDAWLGDLVNARETVATILGGGAATAVTNWFTPDLVTAILTGAGTAAAIQAVLAYRINARKNELTDKEIELNKHETLISRYEAALQHAGTRYDSLANEVAALRADLAERIEKHMKAVEELSEARLELRAAQWEITRLERVVADGDARSVELLAKLRDATEENQALRARVAELEERVRVTEAQLAAHKDAVADGVSRIRATGGGVD